MAGGAVAFAGFAATVVSAVRGILEIKKHLKGKSAKSITADEYNRNKVCIENNQGVIINVDKASMVVINNVRADELASNLAAYVKDHNPNGGFSFTSEQGTLECSPNDVEGMSLPLPDAREILSKRYSINVDLPIKKADLLGASAWEFRYKDKVISVTIKDEKFLELVHKGASVQAGDYISALLEISVDLDENMQPVGKEQFTIVQVNGGIKRNSNLKFDV